MAWRKSPQPLIDLFGRVLPDDARIERRQMFGFPAAFVNGNLFAGLFEDSFMVRLAEADRDELRAAHQAAPFEPMPGRPMREYMLIPGPVLADQPALRRWIDRSLAYAAALPAKKTKSRARKTEGAPAPRPAKRRRR